MSVADQDFVKAYFSYYRNMFANTDVVDELMEFAVVCQDVKARGKKLIFAGNGASASISSHAATDYTQHAGVRAVCFNDHNLITCFGNDYGYENWVARALSAYADEGDVVVLISSSGSSPNIVNAAKFAQEQGLRVVSFSGFSPDNSLRQYGSPDIWVDSRAYNVVESFHLMMILAVANFLRHEEPGENFIASYFESQELALFQSDFSNDLLKFADLCRDVSSRGGKVVFSGNGGSSSIASHAAVDFTKQSKIRSLALNDHNLTSAYSNDFGHEHSLARSFESYVDSRDAVVLLSSSGCSRNIISAADFVLDRGLELVTFTGFQAGNELFSAGAINLWADSINYNIVEGTHMVLIFCVADLLAEEPIYLTGKA